MTMPPAGTRLTAADLMTPAPRSCTTFSSVLEAALIFRDADCGAVPILQDGTPVGVLTDRDVALALAEYPDLASRSVGDIMTKGVISVPPAATIDQIQAELTKHAVRRVLVVEGGQLLGIISWGDLAAHVGDLAVGVIVTPVLESPPKA